MTVGDLIKRLTDFDKDLPITLTDGYNCVWYDLGKADFKVYKDGRKKALDIGIGGCNSEAETLSDFLKEAG